MLPKQRCIKKLLKEPQIKKPNPIMVKGLGYVLLSFLAGSSAILTTQGSYGFASPPYDGFAFYRTRMF